MPYFIYKIDKREGKDNIEKLDCFTSFKEAKIKVRKIRANLDSGAIIAKIIFADNQQEAEAKLNEKTHTTNTKRVGKISFYQATEGIFSCFPSLFVLSPKANNLNSLLVLHSVS